MVIALTVTLATFMEVLDTSIANVALPHIAGSLGGSQEEATWVLTSYLVASAIVLPISGWLANRFGRKRFYMTCVAMFTICSFLLRTGALAATAHLRARSAGPGRRRPGNQRAGHPGRYLPGGKARPGLCALWHGGGRRARHRPHLGGYITDNLDWHWIFFINIPGRDHLAVSIQPHGRRPAVSEGTQPQVRPHRRHGTGLGRGRRGLPGVRLRSRTGERLVRRPFDYRFLPSSRLCCSSSSSSGSGTMKTRSWI